MATQKGKDSGLTVATEATESYKLHDDGGSVDSRDIFSEEKAEALSYEGVAVYGNKGLMPLNMAGSGNIVTSKLFKRTVIALILLSSISIAISTLDFVTDREHLSLAFKYLDGFFLVTFTAELIMQFLYTGSRFFFDGWLVYDLVIICSAWFVPPLMALRTFRVVKSLRLATRVRDLQYLVKALLKVVPKMLSICFLMLILFYTFSVVFTKLFKNVYEEGQTSEDYFSSLLVTSLTLFQIMTLDNWGHIANELMQVSPWAPLLIVLFICCSSFFFLNLIIGTFISHVVCIHSQRYWQWWTLCVLGVICEAVARVSHDRQFAKLGRQIGLPNSRSDDSSYGSLVAMKTDTDVSRLEKKVDELTRTVQLLLKMQMEKKRTSWVIYIRLMVCFITWRERERALFGLYPALFIKYLSWSTYLRSIPASDMIYDSCRIVRKPSAAKSAVSHIEFKSISRIKIVGGSCATVATQEANGEEAKQLSYFCIYLTENPSVHDVCFCCTALEKWCLGCTQLDLTAWCPGCKLKYEFAFNTNSLDCIATAALALRFLTSIDSRDALAKMLGDIESVVNMYLGFGLDKVIHVLENDERARMYWPNQDDEYLRSLNDLIHNFAPELRDKYGIVPVGFLDGLRVYISNKWSRPNEQLEDLSGEKKRVLRKLILWWDLGIQVLDTVVDTSHCHICSGTPDSCPLNMMVIGQQANYGSSWRELRANPGSSGWWKWRLWERNGLVVQVARTWTQDSFQKYQTVSYSCWLHIAAKCHFGRSQRVIG